MKKSVLLCLLEIQEKSKELSSSSLATRNIVTEVTNENIARSQQELFPSLLSHHRQAVERELANRQSISNSVDQAKDLLDPQDPDSEAPFARMDLYKLEQQSSSVNRIHNLLLHAANGRFSENYGSLLATRDSSLQQSKELTNSHIDSVNLSKHIESLINIEEALENARAGSDQESSSSDNNSEGGNSPRSDTEQGNNTSTNNMELSSLDSDNQGNINPGNNNQGSNNTGNNNQEGNNNQGSNNQNTGSLIDDYADLSTDMPSYMDPED